MLILSRALRDILIKRKKREGGRERFSSRDCVCVRASRRAVCRARYSTVQYRPYHIYTQRRPTTDDAEEARAFLYPQRLFLSILAS